MCASVLLSSVSDIMLSSDDQYGQLAPDKVHTSQSVPNSSLNRLKVCISGQLAPDKVHTSQSVPNSSLNRLKVCISGSQRNPLSQLRDVTCHMGCHPTQVNAPRLNPSQ